MSSLSRSSSSMDVDVDVFMDAAHEFEPSQGGVVRWVASQSNNPALQALMREAERDRRTRPSTPVGEPRSWTFPLTSVTSSASFSTSSSTVWHSSGHNSADVSFLPPLSGSSSSASSLSPPQRVSEPSASRQANPLSTVQLRPLASSTSSANRPPRHSARPRSSSHSNPSTSKGRYTPRDDEPEAVNFINILKQTSKQVDENSQIKQHRIRKGTKRDESLESNGIDDLNSSTRTLTKTASASAVCSTHSSLRASEKTFIASTSARKLQPRGRASDKEPGFAPRLLAISSAAPNPSARKTTLLDSTSNDADSAMQDVIDLTETDTEWEHPTSSRADTAMCIDLDDEEIDAKMDVSFYKPESQPRPRVPPPKLKPQPPSQPTRPAPSTQRTGPPPLGMRRAPHLQPSQYNSSQTQGAKGVMVPRFKPPLLVNAGAPSGKNGSGTKLATTSSSRAPPRARTSRTPVTAVPQAAPRDPDSSFDVSFGVDADALEEAMKAYD